MKKYVAYFSIAIFASVLTVLLSGLLKEEPVQLVSQEKVDMPVYQASASLPLPVTGPDFKSAASTTVDAVVHIRTEFSRKSSRYEDFFGELREFLEGVPYDRGGKRVYEGFGSGVIISDDGYIVTNNHVVEGSEAIQVTLNNKRTYNAILIGADPLTDLALVKIEAERLPFLFYGDSDAIEVGEWVLAVGNPFNLTSTVTAGIVSAKARNINILGRGAAIESFIQTDAAVNRGNSGGALVNSNGELVGINAAIASSSGAYEGYSFAIPVNLVRKVVDDFLRYGMLQRGYLGVIIREVNSELADELGLENVQGIYISSVSDYGAAADAGIESGDVIRKIDGVELNGTSHLQEIVGLHRPGDELTVEVFRDGKSIEFETVLRNEDGTTDIVKANEEFYIKELKAGFIKPTSNEKKRLRVNYGMKIKNLDDGPLKRGGIQQGFIIYDINGIAIRNITDIERALDDIDTEKVEISGVYPDGMHVTYGFIIR